MPNNNYERRRGQQETVAPTHTDLNTPRRMRYSYGLLLDKMHFDLEQQYFNDKRWLLNRRIFGPGVVCGLDVQLSHDNKSVVVYPGLAIDRCGREIIVPKVSAPQILHVKPPEQPHPQPHQQQQQHAAQTCQHHHHCDDEYVHLVLCYHECTGDPVPVPTGNCETEDPCVASTVREQYSLALRNGRWSRPRSELRDIVEGRRIERDALVEYVTRPCRRLPDDCCIVLANIRVAEHDEQYEPDDIDINVRPIVYTLPVLYQLIRSLVESDESEL